MITHRTTKNSAGRAYPLLIGLLAFGLAGYFGPWAPHCAAGLVVTGLDLAEYVKFVPQVISGAIPIWREIFYLPLVSGSLIASLFAARAGLPRWLRTLLVAAALPLALALLPPAWDPHKLRLPEFRTQVVALIGCLTFLPLAQVGLRRAPRALTLALAAVLALPAAIAPGAEFLRLRPALAEIYGNLQPLGWGFWANTLGLTAFAVVAVATALRGRPPRR